MKDRTDDEIWAKVEELWPQADRTEGGWGTEYFKVERRDGSLHITVSCMYNWDGAPELTFEKRLALSEFFDTMMIESEEEHYSGGCETCEYGGQWGFTAVVSPGAPYDPSVAASAAAL